MPQFRQKPILIEAIRYTGINEQKEEEITAFAGREIEVRGIRNTLCLIIPMSDGAHIVRPGDWIIKDIKGDLYPCKPDTFAATYEPA